LGWTLRRKNTATLFKIGIPMFFLTFLVYYSVFLGFDQSGESIGILTTTFLSAIALYFSVEKPEPKKLTIIDIIFIWFYIVNGFTITAFSLSSLITEKIHYYTSGFLKFVIPLSLISIAVYLYKRVQNNRKDIILDRDL
jgi:membrane-anchored glycerophosphoryl diester phosphodiesterase (GDPDase)